MTELRICFIGDSLTHGTRDDTTLPRATRLPNRMLHTQEAAIHDATMTPRRSHEYGSQARSSQGPQASSSKSAMPLSAAAISVRSLTSFSAFAVRTFSGTLVS